MNVEVLFIRKCLQRLIGCDKNVMLLIWPCVPPIPPLPPLNWYHTDRAPSIAQYTDSEHVIHWFDGEGVSSSYVAAYLRVTWYSPPGRLFVTCTSPRMSYRCCVNCGLSINTVPQWCRNAIGQCTESKNFDI